MVWSIILYIFISFMLQMEISATTIHSFMDVSDSEITLNLNSDVNWSDEVIIPPEQQSLPSPLSLPRTSTPIAKKHLCSTCGKTFSDRSNLRNHVREKHDNIPRYTCQLCTASFMKKELYEAHVNRHAGMRPHTCNLCQKTYLSKRDLSRHSCNINRKTYVCPTCQKVLNSKRSLQLHRHVHDRSPSFKCPQCGCLFKQRVSKMRHLKSRCAEKKNKEMCDSSV